MGYTSGAGGTTIDDFTIRNHSSNLASKIHNWSGDTVAHYARSQSTAPSSALQERYPHIIPSDLLLLPLLKALLQDLGPEQVSSSPLLFALDKDGFGSVATLGIIVQSLLRHVMSEILAEAIINRLLITDSEQTNLELTKIHTILFDRQSSHPLPTIDSTAADIHNFDRGTTNRGTLAETYLFCRRPDAPSLTRHYPLHDLHPARLRPNRIEPFATFSLPHRRSRIGVQV